MKMMIPCRIGDKVWAIRKYFDGYTIAKQGVVSEMFFCDDMQLCIVVRNVSRGLWGKDIFATQEEAMAEAERRKDNVR